MDALKEKVGGLPVWGWGAIIGGLIAVYVWRTGGRGSLPVAEPASEEVAAGYLGDAFAGGYTPANTAGVNYGAGAIVAAGEEATNFAWTGRAVTFLLTQRYGALEAQRALSAYLNGEPLTAAQRKMIDLVLSRFGLPPEGVTAISPDADEPTKAPGAPQSGAKVATSLRWELPTRATWGRTLTVSVVVAAAGGAVPAGSVTLTNEGRTLGTVPLSGGRATFRVATPASFDRDGVVLLSAVYTPSGAFMPTQGAAPYPVIMKRA